MTSPVMTVRFIASSAALLALLLSCTTFYAPVEAFSMPSCRVAPRHDGRAFLSSASRLSQTADDAFERTFVNEQSTSRSSKNTAASVESPVVPSYKSILVFVSTTILIWLSEPLLSLVDTTVVGQQSNAVMQIAALGPATTLIDSLVYLTYFLSIATTSTISKALAEKDTRKLQEISSQVMGIAAAIGALVTLIVFTAGKPLLTWMAGASASPELVAMAFQYSKIRCAVAPFAILGMVAQSICLACLDTWTPAVAVAVASVVNVVGDVFLVQGRGMGLAGAALATATASVASTLVLLKQIKRKSSQWRTAYTVNGTNGATGRSKVLDGAPVLNTTATSPLDNNATVTSIQPAETKRIPFMSLPDRASFLKFSKLAGPIFFVIVGKVLCYSAMTLKATNFGLEAIATHNIMMRIFFFHATFGDSLSQAAQTFTPQALIRGTGKDVRNLLKKLTIIATCIGACNWTLVRGILKHASKFFTSSPAIEALMAQHSLFMALALVLHSFIMVLEGTIIASNDLGFLVKTYGVTMSILFAQLKFATFSFDGVWQALFLFQVIRLVQFKTRVFQKVVWPRRTNKTPSPQAQP